MIKKNTLQIFVFAMACVGAFTNMRAQTQPFSESFDQWPFDPAWAFNIRNTTQNIYNNRNARLVASPTRLGSGAIRLTVFPGDTASKRNRAEINLFHNDLPGTELWYGWSFMVPEDYAERPDNQLFQIMGQFHDAPDTSKGETWENYPGNAPMVSMNYGTDNGQSGIQLNYGVNRTIDGVVYSRKPVSSALIEKGRWVDLIFHIKWAEDTTGFVAVWKDGLPITPFNGTDYKYYGPNMYNAVPAFLKLGLYRNWGFDTVNSVLYDEVRIGNNHAEVALPPTTSVGFEARVSTSPCLMQTWPNPFNLSLAISYQLPGFSEIELAVYDIRGRRIEILQQGKFAAGVHEAHWQPGASVPSGTYFLRLQAGAKLVKTHKVLFLK